jgi:hypothetical protein
MIPAYPLQWPEGWPRSPSYRRRAAQFRGDDRKQGLSIAEGRKRVLEELARLRVTHDDVVITTNLRLNLQGFPRGDQGEPGDPGVAVYWERNKTRRVMAVDHYTRVADNLGAIAASLEAMRAIERHGGAQILERAFTGFVALPNPDRPRSWRETLGFPYEAVVTADMVRARYRKLAGDVHPDRGGDHDAMAELNRARDDALRAVDR